MKKVFLGVFFSAISLFALNVYAEATGHLKNFMNGTQSAQAQFSQVVTSGDGKSTQQASGSLYFSRPGKFRWVYNTPYKQLLVGDGRKFWIYDEDLNQVTVKKLDQAIGSTPAALLAGNNQIEKAFNLKNQGSQNGLEWLEAKPKSSESTFESIKMGFKGDVLAEMQLKDNFGQLTVIQFKNMQRNPELSANLFKFSPPKGADIIGE
jgi:outer membrane lipoprotein carrier protein